MAQQNKDTNELIKVRRQKLADLQAAGKNPFEIMKYDVTHHSKEIKDNFEELEGKEVAVAGRLMFKRVMGKASFCNVQDLQGGIQARINWNNNFSFVTLIGASLYFVRRMTADPTFGLGIKQFGGTFATTYGSA